jgi:hypothetical protein
MSNYPNTIFFFLLMMLQRLSIHIPYLYPIIFNYLRTYPKWMHHRILVEPLYKVGPIRIKLGAEQRWHFIITQDAKWRPASEQSKLFYIFLSIVYLWKHASDSCRIEETDIFIILLHACSTHGTGLRLLI